MDGATVKPKSLKNKLRDLRDNNRWSKRALDRRRELEPQPGWDSWKNWPVPSWYADQRTHEERPHERRMLDELKRDPEATPQPRRNKRDAGYYW